MVVGLKTQFYEVNLMYTINNCPHLGCKDCLYNGENCKRIGGTNIEFARPWFACCPSGFHVPCNSFIPKHPEYADLKEWKNFDDFFTVYMQTWWSGAKQCGFIINGDKSVRYYVPLERFINGTMIVDNKLMATQKMYYKRTNKGFGYTLVTEEIDGIELE